MPGLGTFANVCGIVIGGLLGLGCGRLLTKRLQDTLMMATAVAVIFIGIGGTLRQMLNITPEGLEMTGTMMMIASLAGGALIGELINLEDRLATFGEWLKERSGSSSDSSFVEGFVTASLTVCIGAMAVIGSITDSLQGDHAILFAKAILDLIIVMIMTATLGKGCIFSAISVGVFQGSITLFARLIAPWMTEAALANLSYVGNILIFCVGINLLFGYRIRVANLLPALLIAIFWPT
ncbi:DUF554 domain-containing protein [Mitsuokella jalaludinii]|uniref:DUF554 domain-containing protein n=1 Tax=Mitsuokella jalaludinii TaxID=187979 RepID=UPI003F9A5069